MNKLLMLFIATVWIFLISCSGSEEDPPTAEPTEVNFGTWTWVSGDDTRNHVGNYGVPVTADTDLRPGGRFTANTWQDGEGDAWVFGGEGYGGANTVGLLNDLWHWDGTSWTWVTGSMYINQLGIYGELGGPAETNNMPGGRTNSMIWNDNAGNVWIFGGVGYDSAGNLGWLNDLWHWDGSDWTWISGSNTINENGDYGELGTSAASNIPGARTGGQTWIASNGDLWMFAGGGYDSAGTNGDLNDLWRWDGSNWTWVGGSNLADQAGDYGSQGVAAASNQPGGRVWAISWIDAFGDFWIFGGQGRDLQGFQGYLNDMWRWDGSNWTWISGSNLRNQAGVYGTKGMADVNNMPGARARSVSWKDSNGDIWVFGGMAEDANSRQSQLNDMWRWDGSNWTWMSGSNTAQLSGAIYGEKGVGSKNIRPGGRTDAVAWIDANDHLWLFSGSGYDVNGGFGKLNDLWRYEPE